MSRSKVKTIAVQLGDAVALVSNKTVTRSKPRQFHRLAPIPVLSKARIFVSCLTAAEALPAADALSENDAFWKNIGLGDPQVVDTALVVPLMRDYIRKFQADHDNSVFHPNGSGGIPSLAHESGVHQRKIAGYLTGEFPRMSVRHADQILLAIGRQDMLGYEIPIRKNPTWSWRKYRLWKAGLIVARKYG